MSSEPLNEQLSIDERLSAVERKSDVFDQATTLFQQSHNTVTRMLTVFSLVFGAVFAISAVAIGYQSYWTWQYQKDMTEQFRESLEREKAAMLRRIRILPYIARIDSAISKLKYRDEGQKDVAVWEDLKLMLDETRHKPEFFDIVGEFKTVVPALKLDLKPEAFRDRYRGVIWVYVILVETGVNDVVDEIRRNAPSAETLRMWADAVFPKVAPANQQEFRESIERLSAVLGER